MNILILTGRFGMGHIKAAEAIRENLLDAKPDAKVSIVDFMDYIFPCMSRHIYNGFNFIVSRCSGIYNYLNKAAGKYANVPLKGRLIKKMDDLIAAYDADIIITALPICGQYISAYKQAVNSALPLYTYITDITAHEEWISDKTDFYFVGSQSTKNALISKGVDACKILITGIPVKKSFRQVGAEKDSQLAAAQNNLQLRRKQPANQKKKQVLIMGGGLGLLPGGNEILKIANENQKISATLIAGKNARLEKEIREKYPNIKVVGFTNTVYSYMEKADLIITKPGGITTFEAIASRTPLYIIHPFLEQEKGNAQYIESHNIGRVLWRRNAAVKEDFIRLIENESLLKTMKENMRRIEENFTPFNPLDCYTERKRQKCS